jgi:hypothetical protein
MCHFQFAYFLFEINYFFQSKEGCVYLQSTVRELLQPCPGLSLRTCGRCRWNLTLQCYFPAHHFESLLQMTCFQKSNPPLKNSNTTPQRCLKSTPRFSCAFFFFLTGKMPSGRESNPTVGCSWGSFLKGPPRASLSYPSPWTPQPRSLGQGRLWVAVACVLPVLTMPVVTPH